MNKKELQEYANSNPRVLSKDDDGNIILPELITRDYTYQIQTGHDSPKDSWNPLKQSGKYTTYNI